MDIQSSAAEKRQAKLEALVESEGYDEPMDMLQTAMGDTLCPWICVNEGCSYTTNYEGDCRDGWCEACGDNSVVSSLVLAELICGARYEDSRAVPIGQARDHPGTGARPRALG